MNPNENSMAKKFEIIYTVTTRRILFIFTVQESVPVIVGVIFKWKWKKIVKMKK